LPNAEKGVGYAYTSPDSSHIVSSTAQDTVSIFKMRHTIAVGLIELRVQRQNLLVWSAPPRANRVRDKETQRMANSWCYPGPHQGGPTSSSFISESWLGGFLHTPPCGLASSHPGSLDRDYPGTKHETTWPRFIPRVIYPCLVLWRGIYPY
jgi:hypothetical protein